MEFKQLQYILTIYEEGGINKAAEKLFISQPSLSKCVINLEKQLGMKIFDRSTTPIRLTPFGKTYIKAAEQILNINKSVLQRVEDMNNGDTGLLRLGVTFFGASQRLPKMLPKFMEKYPGIEIDLTEDKGKVLEEELIKGHLDLLILNGPVDEEKIKFIPIKSDSLYLVTPPGKYDIGEKEKTFENLCEKYDLKNENYILLRHGQKLRRLAERIFEDYGMIPNIKLEMRSIDGAIKLCAEGVAMTIIHESVKENMDYIIKPDFYKLPKRYNIVSGIAYRKNGYTCEAAKKFIDLNKK